MTTRGDRWEAAFQVLRDYVAAHGDARVPYTAVVNGFDLGHWVSAQRTMHARGRLDDERRCRLEATPGWVWRAREDRWQRGFDLLQDYIAVRGDAVVPLSAERDGVKLGEWVHNQRCAFKRGDLRADRERALAGLPGWSWAPFEDRWEEQFGRLEAYTKRHGRIPKPSGTGECALGAWVDAQRRNHAMGILTAGRRERLQGLPGWTWTRESPVTGELG
ncbi:helicase associated domain-containing protein [Mycolicibacterium sp. P1-18]|uniref:helicase associated domain-containing protein n=1 Tax=Mycolicibacterium sp. P1-18 TaxID=2024615 RepID=UPI0011F0E11F|nr:helicase associated domain-containing protein [Mycolicibacterium sp. P1-18]